jgi:hypothetical protein
MAADVIDGYGPKDYSRTRAHMDERRCCVCSRMTETVGFRFAIVTCCGVMVHGRCVKNLFPWHHATSCEFYEDEGDDG